MALLTRSERPTAIFAANNLMALGSLKAMGDLGISCPEEVSLVTFDDVPWAEVVRPRITCVVQPVPEIARLSVQWLLDRIELKDEAPAPRERYFTPTLIRGGSTAAPASSRPKTALPTG